jgi:hypothetical protein
MAGQKTISSTYHEPLPPPPPPPPDLVITGDGGAESPNGDYNEAGIENGKPYYTSLTTPFFLWYDLVTPAWILNTTLGSVIGDLWYLEAVNPEGSYTPVSNYSGNPIVAAGV